MGIINQSDNYKNDNENSKKVIINQRQNNLKNNLLEQLEKMNESYSFKVISPGGNETALIEGIIEDQNNRKLVNDAMMRAFSNKESGKELIEQVGFVSYNKENPRLMMAGGEFCGNATRSFARDLLHGKPGTVQIQVSGVENTLEAGVEENGNARSQMPIYDSLEKIYNSQTDKNGKIIEMEGITHLVTTSPIPFDKNDKDFSKKIKEYSFTIMQANNLTHFPAAGVIFLKDNGLGGYHMTPVVYVKSIDTLFLESACGSGTTASGLLLAKEKGNDIIDLPIVQYSGIPINVSVKFNEEKNKFNYAKISGPIRNVLSGKLRNDLRNDVIIQENMDKESLNHMLYKGGLINLYKKLFAEEPYFEKFTDKEVIDIFNEYLESGELYLALTNLEVKGFGASMPFKKSSIKNVEGLSAELEGLGINIENCVYMADLGVDKETQRQGIGEQLVNSRIASQPRGTTIIMRTSINNYKSQGVYRKWNFQELKTKQYVEMDRIDGSGIRTDERLFLITTK